MQSRQGIGLFVVSIILTALIFSIIPSYASSVANAAMFGIGGGILGAALPAQGMSSLAQARYFAPINLVPYIINGAAGSAAASGAFTASSNLFPGVPFGY